MATGGHNTAGYSLDTVGALTLEDTDSHPDYNGIVVTRDTIVVIDYKPWNERYVYKVRLHRLQDGQLLATSHRLQAAPRDICLMNEIEICVLLWNGVIEIMSIESTDMTYAITTTRTLSLQGLFDRYDAFVRFKDNLVICGVKKDTMSWCIVSFDDGHVETIHQTCKEGVIVDKVWSESSVTTKSNIIYISCYDGSNSPDTGVYGYDIFNPSHCKYTYKHKDLYWPNAITINKDGFIFVCNFLYPFCIHQLTDKCQLVSIFTQGIPRNLWAIFWDQGHGDIFVTCSGSNQITIFRSEHQGGHKASEVPINGEKYQPITEKTSIDISQENVDKGPSGVKSEIPPYIPIHENSEDNKKDKGPIIPLEILRMDNESLKLYKKALQDGKEKVYNIRIMVVGQFGVGKTTLTKRLLGQQVDISERNSTEGIDVHKHCCKISLETGEWIVQLEDSDQLSRLQRLMKLLSRTDQTPDVIQEGEGNIEIIYQRETSCQADINNNNATSARSESDQEVRLPYSQQAELSFHKADERHSAQRSDQNTRTTVDLQTNEAKSIEKKKDAVMEIIQLINENADKLAMDTVKYAALSIWDFAGQYVFYTTHHTFLTSRALYILVIDINQQVTDFITDDTCFFDMEGIKRCKVHDLVEVWLNSVHTCSPSSESSIPHVILVGTHVDKLPEKCRKEVIDKYFKKLRYILKDKPTISHLMDDVAIDNTKTDPMLEELKRRLFELAAEQPHWGEEKPARCLPLEQVIMTLKASGAKVVTLGLIEEINRSGSVRIEDREELDLFLRFHHEMGTILYFSVEGLREKIVLDPQWLIDALKSLITAEQFIRKYPAITSKWYEFEEEGKLTHELIDAIWTEKNHKEFHDNKNHILLLMEKLNIIAKPRLFTQDGKEVKEDNYFLAPCMLRQETPQDVICPKPNPQLESSSVLCYVFTEKFLPSPIFHRLLAACVARWPLATKKKEEMQENQIFCGCCVFQLDKCHKLILYFKEYVIFVRVTRMGIKEKTPSSELCIGAREFITAMLSKIIGYLSQNLMYEHHIQCPEYSGVSVNSLIPVSLLEENAEVRCDFHDNMIESNNLLKFWFKDQEQSGKDDICHLLSDQGLLHVASRLGVEWKFVALNLDLTQAEIDRIQMDMPGKTLDQIRKALTTWRKRSVKKDQDNVLQLLNAIEEVKRNDLVLELKELFHLQD